MGGNNGLRAWALVGFWLSLSGFVGLAISLACKVGLAIGHPWAVALPVGAVMGGLMGLAIPATVRIARGRPKLSRGEQHSEMLAKYLLDVEKDPDYVEALRELDAEFPGR